MKKKVDKRIKTLVENNIAIGQRSMFLVIGDEGKNVVMNFYFLLNRLVTNSRSLNILWCYRKKLDFCTSKKKRFREMKKKIKKGTFDTQIDNNFDSFLNNANIRYCFYKETQNILGKTYSMCILQDFSYITPNILCRCIETVIGGGIIIFLINKLEELKDIYNLTLNYHKKYNMNGACNVYNNYIYRFFRSLNTCKNAMFIDDEMNILPLNDNHLSITKISTEDSQNNGIISGKQNDDTTFEKSATLGGFLSPDKKLLKKKLKFLESKCEELEKQREERKISLYSSKFYNNKGSGTNEKIKINSEINGTQPMQNNLNELDSDAQYSFLDKNIIKLFKICLSIDQLEILINICKILRNDNEKKKNIKEILFNLLANRGRGKSATLGLILSLSIYFNYSNIITCSGNNDSVHTIFEFLDKGLNILGYNEFKDYEKIYVNGKIKEIIIFKNIKYLKQKIRYLDIIENDNIPNCELMIIDEAACIPIDILKNKIKGEITILSTTLNGYEGTGKTFTFKLLKQLKKKFVTQLTYDDFKQIKYLYFDKAFIDITLKSPIRYSYDDQVENWLNNFLCLNCNETFSIKNNLLSSPSKCQLFFVNKNVFKNYNTTSENLLKKIMTLFITSHYKNTPNDLIMILDSQQHHLFVLISSSIDTNTLSVNNIDQIDIYGVIHCSIDGIIDQSKIKKLVKIEDISQMVNEKKEIDDQDDTNENTKQDDNEEQKLKRNDDNANTISNHMLKNEVEGNLIPYIISDYFNYYFYNYIGIRIVRISIHPSMQNLNYGSELLKKVYEYYSLYNDPKRGTISNKEGAKENVVFCKCSGEQIYFDNKLKRIDYIGTCFGLTKNLLIFWKKNNYIPVYLKQQKNEITGEFSVLMLRHINPKLKNIFITFYYDFVRTFCNLLPYSFKKLESFIIYNLLNDNYNLLSNPPQVSRVNDIKQVIQNEDANVNISEKNETDNESEENLDLEEDDMVTSFYNKKEKLNEENIFYFFHTNDICRLKRYVLESRSTQELLYLMDTIAKLILFKKVKIDLSILEYTILYAVSFQKKTITEISNEIQININQTNAIFRKVIHRFYNYIKAIMEKQIEKEVNEEFEQKLKKKKKRSVNVELPSNEYAEELEHISNNIKKKQKKEKLSLIQELNLSGTIKRKQINIEDNE
ncbi:histone acetyltransferase, putative [Plasmodium chabaudi adami]|uniref:RNA cytidine acetyltransferase n=1 Tax=Plasmodium chabaudi adami TaxID=5826 RepID=A0A1D3LH32_PLACE|nr:histone acetyltransferase, putative [Plasmodium chabaudi adami]